MATCGEESGIINVLRLPITQSITCGEYFVVESSNGTSILDFCNLIIGEDNVTFDDVLTNVRSNSGDWSSTHTTVLSNSAEWGLKKKIFDNSEKWTSAHTTVSSNSANWNEAYSWGDHRQFNYLKVTDTLSIVETDPIFNAHPSSNIDVGDINNWNSAHALTSVLNGVTPGTAAGNKALIVDSNLNVSNIHNLTVTGEIRAAGDIIAFDQGLPGGTGAGGGTYKFTSGTTSANGYSNTVDVFVDSTNYFDVMPPAGYNMNHLEAFIASMNSIYFNGGVNADDRIRCHYAYVNASGTKVTKAQSDRIRVWVQNSEQRATPAGNWLAIWKK